MDWPAARNAVCLLLFLALGLSSAAENYLAKLACRRKPSLLFCKNGAGPVPSGPVNADNPAGWPQTIDSGGVVPERSSQLNAVVLERACKRKPNLAFCPAPLPAPLPSGPEGLCPQFEQEFEKKCVQQYPPSLKYEEFCLIYAEHCHRDEYVPPDRPREARPGQGVPLCTALREEYEALCFDDELDERQIALCLDYTEQCGTVRPPVRKGLCPSFRESFRQDCQRRLPAPENQEFCRVFSAHCGDPFVRQNWTLPQRPTTLPWRSRAWTTTRRPVTTTDWNKAVEETAPPTRRTTTTRRPTTRRTTTTTTTTSERPLTTEDVCESFARDFDAKCGEAPLGALDQFCHEYAELCRPDWRPPTTERSSTSTTARSTTAEDLCRAEDAVAQFEGTCLEDFLTPNVVDFCDEFAALCQVPNYPPDGQIILDD